MKRTALEALAESVAAALEPYGYERGPIEERGVIGDCVRFRTKGPNRRWSIFIATSNVAVYEGGVFAGHVPTAGLDPVSEDPGLEVAAELQRRGVVPLAAA